MTARDGAAAPFFDIGWKPEIERTKLYLGIDDGGSQREEAVAFVESVAEMLAGLTTKDGDLLGWSVNAPSIFDDEPAPRYSFHSTAAAMFGAIFYRYGCVPAKCKNCGNGILVKTKGKRREFCSPSCRTRYSNRKAGPVLRRDRRLLGDDIRCADLAGLDLQDCGARRIGCRVFPGNGNPVLVIYP